MRERVPGTCKIFATLDLLVRWCQMRRLVKDINTTFAAKPGKSRIRGALCSKSFTPVQPIAQRNVPPQSAADRLSLRISRRHVMLQNGRGEGKAGQNNFVRAEVHDVSAAAQLHCHRDIRRGWYQRFQVLMQAFRHRWLACCWLSARQAHQAANFILPTNR